LAGDEDKVGTTSEKNMAAIAVHREVMVCSPLRMESVV
jgi:hypothetical protein